MDGAIDCLRRHGVAEEHLVVYRVPGAFEIPLLARKLAKTRKFGALICLGALIRGETPHFDYLSREVTRGLAQVSQECEIPIAFGILTTNTLDQALERAGAKRGNKGWEAAESALEMANLTASIEASL